MTRETIRQYIKQELRKKCVRKYKTFFISRSQEEKRARGESAHPVRKERLGRFVWTDEKLFRQSATGVSGQNSRFWMDERNTDGSRNSKRTAIRTQTPTGNDLKFCRLQHNPGMMVSIALRPVWRREFWALCSWSLASKSRALTTCLS